MIAMKGRLYTVIGLATCVAFFYMCFGDFEFHPPQPKMRFVERNGTQLFLDGRPFYVNGWNSYWLMDQAVDEFSRPRVRTVFKAASRVGLTVCRTWAFNDGTYHALQVSPGQFDERVFKALDLVIVEAGKNGIRLLLSLVNNLEAYGGKNQYVKWAWEEGVGLSSANDSFFFDPSIRIYFKTYLKTILTRKNHITGIEYKDDPTIFAWELINEPHCMTDPTGDTLQEWIEEMAGYLKSIDKKHLLTVGHEGFYGPSSPVKNRSVNPSEWESTLGADFIRNSKIPTIDFASIHFYPDQWMPGQPFSEKIKFVSKWMDSHIDDGDKDLRKPIMLTEFGLSNLNKDFNHSQREPFYEAIFNIFYKSAKAGRAGAGTFLWQLLVGGMEEYNDDFGIVAWESPSLYGVIKDQSCRLAEVRFGESWARSLSELNC
ncbi:Mannan endo-1,4-beta-mannosidase 2 [Acorus gramineus]|uniref:mannan endo-1,4-beta-mannosidase n=1 Tax=Acorus gramineus TaxID=55184 RepID=A0AAV9AUT5_ACOGR|nr:Mannan endo-1,4-beta-mannosidase 2 [Acorus gramineus]